MNVSKQAAWMLIGCALASSCQTKQKALEANAPATPPIESLAYDMYGSDAQIFYDESRTYAAICHSEKDGVATLTTLHTCIVDLSSLEIVKKEVTTNCRKHFWRGDNFIAIQGAGIVKRSGDTGINERILFNVKAHKMGW